MPDQIATLEHQLENIQAPKQRVEILHELGWTYFLDDDVDNLTHILYEAQQFLRNEAIISQHHAHHELLNAFASILTTGYVDALEHALSTQQKWANTFSGAWQWRMPYLLGRIHSRMGNFNDAMNEFRIVAEIAREINDPIGESLGVTGIGYVYGYLREYEKALQYYLQSLEIANRIDDHRLKFWAHFSLCQLYIYLKDLHHAEQAAHATLAEAQVLAQDKFLVLAITRIVHVHLQREEYPQAEKLLLKHLSKMPDSRTMQYARANLWFLLARVYNSQQQFQQAIEPLSRTIEWAKALGDNPIVMECYEDLIKAYEQIGDYQEALRYQKEYFDLYKKFHNERNVEKIQMLEILHRTREAETQLAHQKEIAQEAINQAEQTKQYFEELNNIKSKFIDSATHDLKNPLAGIRLNADILRRKIDSSYHRHLDRIERDTERMNQLIADMLDVAKLETGKALNLSLYPLEHLINEVVSTHNARANERGIQIVADYAVRDVIFYFDLSYLYRCLSNLLSNAIKYSADNTQITMSLDIVDNFVCITVADQGMGIPAADLPYIFDRFYRVEHAATAKIEGTGLGLSIVKSIVEQHNGTVTVNSKLGEGTTLTILLPYITHLSSTTSTV